MTSSWTINPYIYKLGQKFLDKFLKQKNNYLLFFNYFENHCIHAWNSLLRRPEILSICVEPFRFSEWFNNWIPAWSNFMFPFGPCCLHIGTIQLWQKRLLARGGGLSGDGSLEHQLTPSASLWTSHGQLYSQSSDGIETIQGMWLTSPDLVGRGKRQRERTVSCAVLLEVEELPLRVSCGKTGLHPTSFPQGQCAGVWTRIATRRGGP